MTPVPSSKTPSPGSFPSLPAAPGAPAVDILQDDNELVGRYHRLERSYGAFARYFSVPETVDAEKVQAAFKDGVLTIALPKEEMAKPRQIKINGAN